VTTLPAPGDAGPFSRLTVLWMVVVGGLSGLLFLVLSAYAPDLRRPSDGGEHALSNSAVGFAGLAELLRAEGAPVAISHAPHPEQEGRPGLLILTPSLMTDAKAMLALKASGRELIILPKWETAPDPHHPDWVVNLGLAPAGELEERLFHRLDRTDHVDRRTGRSQPLLTVDKGLEAVSGPILVGATDSLQTIAGPDTGWDSVITVGKDDALLIKKVGAEIYVLTDPDILNNHGLAQLANAKGASTLIEALRGRTAPVVFDVTLAGFTRTRSLLRLAFEPPFLAATLCALAAAALIGLHAVARFGPAVRPAPPFARGKRALADNAAALMRLVRREHRMGAGYAHLTRTLAARAAGAPRDLGAGQLDALLDRFGKTRAGGASFSELAGEAGRARDVPALMAAASKLYQWRVEMTRERR
jgi:hypothetical protein